MFYWAIGFMILAILIIYFKDKSFTNKQYKQIRKLEAELLDTKINKNNEMIDFINDIKDVQATASIWANHDTEISNLIELKLSACLRKKYDLDIKKELNTIVGSDV